MTRALSQAELSCWRSFIETSLRLTARLEDDLRADTGLSMADYHVLVVLSEAPERRLRMGELASRLVFSPSRLTYQISSMRKRGLVERETCETDRRGNHAVLTPAGLNALRAAAPRHLAAVRRLFLEALEPPELTVLAGIFDRLDGRLRAGGGPADLRSARP